jgi:hypothetical protein
LGEEQAMWASALLRFDEQKKSFNGELKDRSMTVLATSGTSPRRGA